MSKVILIITVCLVHFGGEWPYSQPRPQGFYLKKKPHFLREKPWGRGWPYSDWI